MIVLYIFLSIATLFSAWRVWRRLRHFLHMFQLEGYKTNEYRVWLGKRIRRIIITRSHIIGMLALAVLWLGSRYGPVFWTGLIVVPVWAVTFASSRYYRSDQQKKPLTYTARTRRLLIVAAVLASIPVVLGFRHLILYGVPEGLFGYLLGFWLADFGGFFWILIAGYLTIPIERSIHEGFKRQARTRLAQARDLTVIGITGSYGKTSVKFILAEILGQRFNVLATPGSYNTPMGICLVVNNKLKPEHQILILEMGARYTGDIRELCELARPDIGIVTSVGVAHLETMGPIENIARVKAELVQHMKPGGPVILNADDPRVAAMAEKASGPVLRVSVMNAEANLMAHDIRYGPEGATFSVGDNTGTEVLFQTRLLGRHNVLNILLALAVGRHLGLRLRQMAHAVRRIKPVEHRLQLRQEGAVTVIDDAFNSNPVGARNAVEILGQFETGKRVLVTPGMVELGERQQEENRAFGSFAADHIDLAVLVGAEQTRPIQVGLREAGFSEEKIQIHDTLFDAQAYLQTILAPGDVVLYENDLPDQYNE